MTYHVSKRRRLNHSNSAYIQENSDDAYSYSSEGNSSEDAGSGVQSSMPIVHLRSSPKTQRHKVAQESKPFDLTQISGMSLLQLQVKQILSDVSEKHDRLGTAVDSNVKQLERIIYAIPPHKSVPV